MVTKWYLVGKVNSSQYRKRVLVKLGESEQTPTSLEKILNIKISHISRAIKELVDLKLVKCLNPQLRKSKIYSLTQFGKEILRNVNKIR